MKNSVIQLLTIAIASAFVGCSAGSDMLVDTSPHFQASKIGSQFIFRVWDVDSIGNLIPRNGFVSQSVIATATSYSGKSQVTQIQNDSSAANVAYINTESSGDLSLYAEPGWTVLPVKTRRDTVYITYDTVSGVAHKTEQTFMYDGIEDLTLAGHTFKTVRVMDVIRSWTNNVADDIPDHFVEFWLATETGWYVKRMESSHRVSGKVINGSRLLLDAYTMK